MNDNDLRRLERSTFRAATDTGLWDTFLASVFSMLAIAPLLSGRLGDFWSSAVFLPVWAGVYLTIRIVHERVVVPRIGIVEVGPGRKARLRTLTWIMLTANVVAFAAGIYAATRTPAGDASYSQIAMPPGLLAGFTLAAWFLSIPRLFLYGLLLAAAPIVGEELFQRKLASHHGFPVTFGVAAGVIFVSGLVRFWRVVLRRAPARNALAPETGDA